MMARSPEVLPRRRFDIDDVERMTRAGIFPHDERIELIDGDVVEVPVPGPRHSGNVDRLNHLLGQRCSSACIVRVQNPLLLDRFNCFLPDLTLLRPDPDYYRSRHPTPADTLLAIEIADTSLRRDRDAKLPIYARLGVPELWILELRRQRIHAFAEPAGERYAQVRVCTGADVLRLPGGDGITAAELLG